MLARFTPKNNRTTLAGMTAIHSRTGMSRGRADVALKTLVRAGLFTTPKRGSARSLVPWGISGRSQRPLARQPPFCSASLARKTRLFPARIPTIRWPLRCLRRAFWRRSDPQPAGMVPGSSPDWVWLPNTIVDGFGEGDAPLARLRQIQDPRAILLFLDCYRLANLAEDGGLPWWNIRRKYKRVKIYTHGQFTIWGFAPDRMNAQWDPLFTRSGKRK